MARKKKALPSIKATGDHPVSTDKEMPLVEHLVELRTRLLWSAVVFIAAFFLCFAFAQQIYDFLVQPLAAAMEKRGGSQRMIYTALTEAFFTYVKVGAFGAALVSFPLVATQVWMFVAPGLYRHEKRAFLPFLILSPLLFVLGGAMVYYVVMPMAWEFLLGFQTTRAQTVLPIQLEAKVGEYLGLVMRLILAFGFCFQMPIILTLLARIGVVSAASLAKGRKYAIVFIFIIAAVVTPPDIISQVLLAIPMIGLYEISVWAAKAAEKARQKKEAADEALYTTRPNKPAPAAVPVFDDLGDPHDDELEAAALVAPAFDAPKTHHHDGLIDETDFNETP